jgi:arylamine N-acetyltransferase
MALNTEQVVATLKAAGLDAAIENRRMRRAGFRVRQFSATEIGVSSDTMTLAQWTVAMVALEVAGFTFTYRTDAGMGARVKAA